MKRYPAYKDSGVEWLGDVPEGWSISRLKPLFEIRKRIAGELGHDILSVTQRGIKVKDIESNDGQLSMDYSKYQIVEPDDFVMNHMDLLTGYVDISKFKGVTSPDYRVFSAVSSSIWKPYFLYLMQNGYQRHIFYAFGQGASGFGRWRMPTESFYNFQCPLPSLPEQRAIAAFLDREVAKIDGLIEEQRRLIALLAEKRQATISHAVTKGLNPNAKLKPSGIDWLGDVPEGWDVVRVKHLAKLITKGTTPTTIGFDFIDNGIRFLKAENVAMSGEVNLTPEFYISDEADEALSRSRLQRNDVLVVIAGATTGKSAVIKDNALPANTNQAVAFIRCHKEAYSYWIQNWLSTQSVQNVISLGSVQSAQPNLSMEDLGNIPIVLPPLSELDELITHCAKEAHKSTSLIIVAEAAISLLEERRSALISAAVTGKIDVRNLVSAEETLKEPA